MQPYLIIPATAFPLSDSLAKYAASWPCIAIKVSARDGTFHENGAIQSMFQWLAASNLPCRAIVVETPADSSESLSAVVNACKQAKGLNAPDMLNAPDIVVTWETPYGEHPNADMLGEIADIARRGSYRIAVDVAGPRDIMHERKMNIARLAHPHLTVAIDLGNYLTANPTSSVEILLLRAIGEMGALVLRDAPPQFKAGQPNQSVQLGEDGLIDYARVAQVARDVAFGGPCLFDLSSNLNSPWEFGAATIAEWRDDARQHLQLCGWLSRFS